MSPAAVALKLTTHSSDFEGWAEEQEFGDNAETGWGFGSQKQSAQYVNRLVNHGTATEKTDLTTLRSQVATIVAGNHSAGPAWATGVGELDGALGGGVPRGRVTEVVGPLGAGKTSLVRQLVAGVLAEGGWVAWIDATRTLAPQELAGLGDRLVAVRPRDHTRGAWCADLLLRSGVFALVVLDGAPVLSRVVGVRLSQLARERDAAFVVLREGTQASRLGGAVRLQIRPQAQPKVQGKAQTAVRFISRTLDTARPQPMQKRKYSVLVEKGGSYRTVEVNCGIVLACRVCANSEIPDRRGVARGTRAPGNERTEQDEQFQQQQEREQAAVAVAGQQLLQHFSKKGRGRARAAESGYGRSTRRGTARRLLREREQQYEQRPDRKQRQSQHQ